MREETTSHGQQLAATDLRSPGSNKTCFQITPYTLKLIQSINLKLKYWAQCVIFNIHIDVVIKNHSFYKPLHFLPRKNLLRMFSYAVVVHECSTSKTRSHKWSDEISSSFHRPAWSASSFCPLRLKSLPWIKVLHTQISAHRSVLFSSSCFRQLIMLC